MADVLAINSVLYARKGLFQRVGAVIGPHYKVYLQFLHSLARQQGPFESAGRGRYALSCGQIAVNNEALRVPDSHLTEDDNKP